MIDTEEDPCPSADARHESARLDLKIAQAGKDPESLEQTLRMNRSLQDRQLQLEQLVEANQQLVLAMLMNQTPAKEPAPTPPMPGCRPADLVEANEKLVLCALQARHAQAKAEQEYAQQQSALAAAAHELRNPLTPISLLAERMVSAASEDLPQMQAMIEGQVRHMSRLIEDLLDVSCVSKGKLRLTRLKLDVAQILVSATDACRPLMNTKGLAFTVSLPIGPVWVWGDAVRLTQVFHNLLTNAAKYTPGGGAVEVVATVDAHAMEISIRDNGIGISSHVLPTIFNPYVQDAHAVGFNGTGLGIGLTVVRELVQAHGGTVTGHSAGANLGSLFTVKLPLLA
jgi:signal transduction histidine kinase